MLIVVYSEMKKERREGKNFLLKFKFVLALTYLPRFQKRKDFLIS